MDAATIGVLLVADRDETVVQYALQSSTAPVAVSRYQLSEEVRQLLPTDELLRQVGRQFALDWTRHTEQSTDTRRAERRT